MAIAMEFYNVVVKKTVVAAKYPGGIDQCRADYGPSFLEDEYLTRGGAMNWFDVERCIRQLESHGMQYLDTNGNAIDIVVVDMIKGPMAPCDWLEFDSGECGPRCWLRGTEPGLLSKPIRSNADSNAILLIGRDGKIVSLSRGPSPQRGDGIARE